MTWLNRYGGYPGGEFPYGAYPPFVAAAGSGAWLVRPNGASYHVVTQDLLSEPSPITADWSTDPSFQLSRIECDGARWYAFTDFGSWRSTDGLAGETWESITNPGAYIAPASFVRVLTNTISVSFDQGASWDTKVSTSINWNQVLFQTDHEDAIVVGNGNDFNPQRVFASVDGGVIWAELPLPPYVGDERLRGVACRGDRVWIRTVDPSTYVPRLLTIQVGGSAWTDVSSVLDLDTALDELELYSAFGRVFVVRIRWGSPVTTRVFVSDDGETFAALDDLTADWYFSAAGHNAVLMMNGNANSAIHAFGEAPIDCLIECADPLASPVLSVLNDWTADLDPRLLQRRYILRVEAPGFAPITVPISSWQATANLGERASFVQAVAPAVGEYIDALTDRQDGALVILMGYVFDDGSVQYDEVIRASFQNISLQQGAYRATATLSGYSVLGANQVGVTRALKDVRDFAVTNGRARVTCGLDMFLRPGMTATVATEGLSFPVSYVNYFVNGTGEFCQVGE
ncbi:MAG TPA: hypothetical protein PKE37_15460 [Thiomonas arsenitoxydans]|uniref:hypothetical protein n=1 Tax=Thiomonas arsenitoxydans (strain DSM 22701 / CIP 110005 / 3As) TaxID=426114 RepID=UPI002C3B4FEC|nr:hypothetical protein [Thiomonas arsenitoxydans]HML83152.1 hypothetical protein [Thiomonas arsenitoxydans]